ncbi:fatty acyl-AMP ligase [Spongiactinospora sp. TRM90649]|uniref:fatty acyl-AMP ligase n=1 Tax=Spongiactinospora sp. TRM90649 TaxID=3031114 RepID=UPI0023F8098E|nr:fatty acyl-AMP ligase [Spongiactinospora sp. TRM90649]MDF5758944.1 fatty acyl-AMP ligase [Spongiactinospora sp. TRM90649]
MTVTIPTLDHAVTGYRTVSEAIRRGAVERPHQIAYGYLRDGEELSETITYAELDAAAEARAAAFAAMGLSGGSAVLLYPTGLEFVRALYGCMRARVSGAPAQVPSRRKGLERLRIIADDAGATTVLTTEAVRQDLIDRFGDLRELDGLTILTTESLPSGGEYAGPDPTPDDVALLQYTSGSTGNPKGVMVTHANFLANVAETEDAFPTAPESRVVSWLPLFHDMGLLLSIVFPVVQRVPAYLMAPEAFIRRPARWLEAVSKYRGTHAAAPSFAYELCVRAAAEGKVDPSLDLSSWRMAANGAEPVRWHTVRGFVEAFAPLGLRATTMCPGYGLAENTLKATASTAGEVPHALWVSADALLAGRVEILAEDDPAAKPVVSCGAPSAATRVRIVDPGTLTPCEEGFVGEVWIDGPCVAAGYLGRAAETAETFMAHITGEPADVTYLRTGDLGFMVNGELFVAGRLKDMIIRKGRNYYPQDIELSAEGSAEGLRPNCAAAFSVDNGEREELVVVVEADGRALRAGGAQALRDRVRHAIFNDHRLKTDEVVLVRRGVLPKTTSGKVQRRACRKNYLDGELKAVQV